METALDALSIVLLASGLSFFAAATIGLIRFEGLFNKLHAVTKADNVGLGLVLLAAALQTPTWAARLKLALIWMLVLIASSIACYLLGRRTLHSSTHSSTWGVDRRETPWP